MTNRTKLQLEDAFKKLLLEKPFHKITIKNLTDACYLSRMSFYYHFLLSVKFLIDKSIVP